MAKTLKDLTAQEVLALAIQAEEEDGRIYADLAERIGARLSRNGQVADGDARRGERPSAPADRALSAEIRRAHPAHPAAGREGLHHAQAALADGAT